MTRELISEDASDNGRGRRRKRGRPKVVDPDGWLRPLWPDVTTDRGLANRWYQARALCCLNYEPAFAWLVSNEEAIRAGHGKIRATIVGELGRIEDEQVMRQAAARICELKPSARDAVVMLRRLRTGKSPEPNCLDLTKALIGCVNDYLKRHPEASWQLVRTALENAQDAVEESAQGDDR
jgi:hypothetical protein